MSTVRKLSRSGALSSAFKGIGATTSIATLLLGAATPFVAGSHATPVSASDPYLTAQLETDSDPRFSCQMVDGEYTVVYYPQSQPDQAYPWAKPTELGGGWTPERRCNEISRRLEFYRPDGLVEMQTAVENGYNTVCVTTQQVPTCRIVLTVPPGQDPVLTRDRVFENLAVADQGQQTDAVNALTGDRGGGVLNQIGEALNIDLPSMTGRRSSNSRSGGINLRPFLDPADGGTGAMLRNSSAPSAPRLNPDNFR